MNQRKVTASMLAREFEFTTSRSSGPGGQNVNKVNTKVTLKFDIKQSQALTEEEKTLLIHKLSSRLTNEGALILSSQDKRSQLDNKQAVIAKFEKLLAKAFEPKKKRKPTRPSKESVRKRIEGKKLLAEKKKWRKKL